MNKKMILTSIIGGIIITLITGLFLNTPPMLVGASHFGYPLPWLTRLIIHPQYFPWSVSIPNLIIDIIIWSIIMGIILFVLLKIKKTKPSNFF